MEKDWSWLPSMGILGKDPMLLTNKLKNIRKINITPFRYGAIVQLLVVRNKRRHSRETLGCGKYHVQKGQKRF